MGVGRTFMRVIGGGEIFGSSFFLFSFLFSSTFLGSEEERSVRISGLRRYEGTVGLSHCAPEAWKALKIEL